MPVDFLPSPADCDFCKGTRKMAGAWVNKFVEWLKRPYDDQMSAFGWFAFAGLILVIGFMWNAIIKKIAD